MNCLKLPRTLLLIVLFVTLALNLAAAQTPSVLTTGLQTPGKIALTEGGHLLVAEDGRGINNGRVSRVDRCGRRTTYLISPRRNFSAKCSLIRHENAMLVSVGFFSG